MNELEELIQSADNLCARLDKMASDEKKFCDEIRHWLEQYSWSVLKMCNDLKSINEYGA